MDVERGFEPKYVTIKGKAKTLAELKKAAKAAATIFLATDPDREGEAIAWHVADQINSQVPVHRVLFHEITRDAVLAAMRGAEADRRAEGGRAAGAPHPRPAGGLQGEPDPLADHQDRTLRRPGADRRAAPDRRARAGDPRVQAAGVLDHRGAVRGQGADLRGLAGQARRQEARSSTTRPMRARWSDAVRALPFVVTEVGAAPPEQASGRAVHHQHAAAGGRQEARLLVEAHHAGGAGSLRGHRDRRGRAGRPHHLHAHRLGPRGGDRGRRRARAHRRALRQGVSARAAQRVQRPEERPSAGRARGDPADRRPPAPRPGRSSISRPTSSSSTS